MLSTLNSVTESDPSITTTLSVDDNECDSPDSSVNETLALQNTCMDKLESYALDEQSSTSSTNFGDKNIEHECHSSSSGSVFKCDLADGSSSNLATISVDAINMDDILEAWNELEFTKLPAPAQPDIPDEHRGYIEEVHEQSAGSGRSSVGFDAETNQIFKNPFDEERVKEMTAQLNFSDLELDIQGSTPEEESDSVGDTLEDEEEYEEVDEESGEEDQSSESFLAESERTGQISEPGSLYKSSGDPNYSDQMPSDEESNRSPFCSYSGAIDETGDFEKEVAAKIATPNTSSPAPSNIINQNQNAGVFEEDFASFCSKSTITFLRKVRTKVKSYVRRLAKARILNVKLVVSE